MKPGGYTNILNESNLKSEDGYKVAYQRTKKFFIDEDRKLFCGRTPVHLGYSIALVFVMSLILIGFTTAMFFIFTEFIINEDRPFRSGMDNILSEKPALSFRPLVDFKTALIRYRDSDLSTYITYIQSLRAFIDLYEDPESVSEEAYASCRGGVKTPNDINKPCRFDLEQLDFCRKQYNFGYDRARPCIMLKMNRIYGWMPNVKNVSITRDILVECNGQNLEDEENFNGVKYFPNVTIANKTYGVMSHLFYPYLVQYGYRQPLVGVLFKTPRRNVILMIKCRVVNLVYEPEPLTFEILID